MIEQIKEEEFVTGSDHNKVVDAANKMEEQILSLEKRVASIENSGAPIKEKENNGSKKS